MNIKQILIVCIILQTIFSYSLHLASHPEDKQIYIQAQELNSEKTNIPFEYHYLKRCGQNRSIKQDYSLGELLLGDRIESTEYKVQLNLNDTCVELCDYLTLDKDDIKIYQWLIEREYQQTLVLDGLPNISQKGYSQNDDDSYQIGFPIGQKVTTTSGEVKYMINNHLTFFIKLHPIQNSDKPDEKFYQIVEFLVQPSSLSNKSWKRVDEDGKEQKIVEQICNLDTFYEIQNTEGGQQYIENEPFDIKFTYNIVFELTDKTDFNTRWDVYRKGLGDDEIHWLSLLRISIINLFLTVIIQQIMNRVLAKDYEKYQQVNQSEDIEQDQGWKQIAMDVFRSPKNPLILSVFSGVGIQICLMIVISVVFTVLGIENEHNRGQFLDSLIICYVFMGSIAGYWAARIYKMLGGIYWLRVTFLLSSMYPLFIFVVFTGINVLLLAEKSSMAVSFKVIIELGVLWLGVSTPLVFLGSFLGFKRNKISYPCRVNPVPSYIPPAPWYIKSKFTLLAGGLLPFGTVMMELSYIMQSIWHHNYYYLFAFFFVVLLLLIITCAEISIVITYLQLNHGNHKWQWRSFLVSSMCGVYIFGFSIIYWVYRTNIVRFTSIVMYFGIMGTISVTAFLFCGAIGFISSAIFVRKIYSAIKAD